VRDRLADVEAWRDRIRSLEPGPARTEAESIAHAIGWSATQVPAALDVEALEDVLGDELEERRRHRLDVLTRCPGEVPPDLLPRAAS